MKEFIKVFGIFFLILTAYEVTDEIGQHLSYWADLLLSLVWVIPLIIIIRHFVRTWSWRDEIDI